MQDTCSLALCLMNNGCNLLKLISRDDVGSSSEVYFGFYGDFMNVKGGRQASICE